MTDILYCSRHTLERSSTNTFFANFLIKHKLNLIYLSTYGDIKANTINTNNPIELPIKVMPHNNIIFKGINYFIFCIKIFFTYLKYRPKLIIIHDSIFLPILLLLKLFFKIHIGIHFHEIIWDCGYNKYLSKIYKLVEKFGMKFVKISIFPSEKRMNLISENLNIMSNGFIFPNYNNINYKIAKGPINNKKNIIYFGAVNYITYDVLLSAINHLTKYEFTIEIYGFGDRISHLRKNFKKNSKVIFYEPISIHKIETILPNYLASICVYPANNLNNIYCEPRKLYDSIGRGLPVIINEIAAPKFMTNYLIPLHEANYDLLVLKKNKLINDLPELSKLMTQYKHESEKKLIEKVLAICN